MPQGSPQQTRGLRAVALIEIAKGVLVLLAGAGLLSLIHHDAGLAAESLVRHLHLNPASGTPRVFIDTASKLDDARLWLLSGAALAYALVRFAEGWGLWRGRAWAEWFGVLAGALYIPFELIELAHEPHWAMMAVLAANVAVVAVLSLALIRRRKSGEA